ncbi:MAG: hypothetical protein HS115_02805 [Spirochaetales bacterium]|nr:hypothetical protein [Spirochaetales bacterium]
MGKQKGTLERFLAILPDETDLGGLLECMFQSIQARKQGMQTAILVPEALQELARESGSFDRIHLQSRGRIDMRLKRFKADVIYLADETLKNQVKLLFSGAKIKLSRKDNPLSRFFPSYDISRARDRKKMAEIFQVSRGRIKLDFRVADPVRRETNPYVYLSLLDRHDSTNYWPPGYASRLARLLTAKGARLMVHIPATARREDVIYLRRNALNMVFLDNLSPVERARHIQHAMLFIGSPGPETALACALGRPVIFLSDMRAARMQNEDGQQSIARRLESVFTQIVPGVDECINDCRACAYSSCLEYISPELVFSIAGEMIPQLNGHASEFSLKESRSLPRASVS